MAENYVCKERKEDKKWKDHEVSEIINKKKLREKIKRKKLREQMEVKSTV
jgi:hypothetical protein